MKRFILLLALLAATFSLSAQSVRVYLIGDSTCATKDLAKQNPERGWGHMFQPFFDDSVAIENHAANGRSTRSFRDEGRWDSVFVKLQPGDYVFIQFGHNDGKKDSPRYASHDDYAANLHRYVAETREKGAIPVLLTPVSRRHFVDGVLTDTHGEYLMRCRAVAEELHVPLIDANVLTSEWLSACGDDASKAFFMQIAPGVSPLYPDGRNDNTHFNIGGARVVARMIAEQLPAVVPELGKHVVNYDFVVAKDGSGDFFTLTEAVAAIPDFCGRETRILICNGVYREKISIPATKRRVLLEGRGDVRVTWDDYSSKKGITGAETGTSGSATIYFGGEGWCVRNITFENAAGRVGQAVAVQCLGSNIHFENCRLLGDQDTLYLYGIGNRAQKTPAENARITFERCYIEGTTDFIFGSAMALFRDCEIHAKADSYLTAASTCPGQPCGLIFERCRLTAAAGVTKCYLGRPWREYAQTVFIDCQMGGHIRPEGWHDWNKPAAHKTAFYAEYNSTGTGAALEARVKWSHRLSEKEARKVLDSFGK